MDREIYQLKHMQNRRLPYLNSNPLYIFGEKYGLDFLGQIDRKILQRCYFDDIILCRKVLHQLAFFGAMFEGGLENYAILQHPDDSLFLWKTSPREQLFNPPFPFSVLQKVKEFGILYEQDAVGLPLLSFVRYHSAFPFEKVLKESGFDLISYDEFALRLNNVKSVDELELDQYPHPMGTADIVRVNSLADSEDAAKLKAETDDMWARVLNDIETLTREAGGKGIKSTREVLEDFKALREKIEVSQKNKSLEFAVEARTDTSQTGLRARLEFFISCVGKIIRDKKNKSAQRPMLILETKFNMLDEQKSPALKDVGRILGITGERVRQILSRFWRKEFTKYNFSIEDTVGEVRRLGGLIPVKKFLPDFISLEPFEQFVINEVLNIFGLAIMEPGVFLASFTKGEYEAAQNELAVDLQGIGEFPLYPAAIEGCVEAFVRKKGFHAFCQNAFLRLAFTCLLVPWGDGYILKELFKSEKIVSLLKEYRQGLAIHRDFNVFFKRLDSVFPGEFHEHDRYIYTSIVNSDKALLWGWGVYIHRDNIRATKADFAEVVAWIQGQFTAGVEKLSAYAAYHQFRVYLHGRGIPNEHALYGCLRHFYKDAFYLPKTPYVYPVDVRKGKQNTEIIAEFLRKKEENLPYAELQAEFIDRRGWKEYTLNQAIISSQEIIRTARGEYGLLEFYPGASVENMEPLARLLEATLSQEKQQVNIRLVFAQQRVTCTRLKICSDVALYSLMEKYFAQRFSFPQYPHVQASCSDSSAEISNIQLLDDYMKQLGNAIFRSELKEEFVLRRFWTEKALENALRANPQIFVLQYGATAEYVHAEVLGWNSEKQTKLEGWAKAYLEQCRNIPVPFGNVQRDLFRPQQFPRLDAGFRWTSDLLKDRLKDCAFIRFLGTTKGLFVPVPNVFAIKDDITFLEYILRTEFQGSADVANLQKRLAELEFSRDGKIPRTYKLMNKKIPYEFTTDKITLRHR